MLCLRSLFHCCQSASLTRCPLKPYQNYSQTTWNKVWQHFVTAYIYKRIATWQFLWHMLSEMNSLTENLSWMIYYRFSFCQWGCCIFVFYNLNLINYRLFFSNSDIIGDRWVWPHDQFGRVYTLQVLVSRTSLLIDVGTVFCL